MLFGDIKNIHFVGIGGIGMSGIAEILSEEGLSVSGCDLKHSAATELLFDRRLLAIVFPPRTERIARLLFAANQARARLTGEAAASTSLSQLRAYQHRLDSNRGNPYMLPGGYSQLVGGL